ncbi:MAG: hypothetical protein R3F51_17000 [Cyanobacteriota/Melainabacteria group bacterium]
MTIKTRTTIALIATLALPILSYAREPAKGAAKQSNKCILNSNSLLGAFRVELWEAEEPLKADRGFMYFKNQASIENFYRLTVCRAGNLALCHHFDEAIDEYTKAIDMNMASEKSSEIRLLISRAKLYRKTGQKAKALADLQNVKTKLDSNNSETSEYLIRTHKEQQTKLAYELYQLEQFEIAEPILTELAKEIRNITSAYYVYLLALCQSKQGKNEIAIENYKNAASLFYAQGHEEETNDCLEHANEIKALIDKSNRLLTTADLIPPSNEKREVITLITNMTTQNGFESKEMFSLLPWLSRTGTFSPADRDRVKALRSIRVERPYSRDKITCLRIAPLICTIRKSDLESITKSLEQISPPKNKKNLFANVSIYKVPSGTILLHWSTKGFKTLSFIKFYPNGQDFMRKIASHRMGFRCVFNLENSPRGFESEIRGMIKKGNIVPAIRKLEKWNPRYRKEYVVIGLLAEIDESKGNLKSALKKLDKAMELSDQEDWKKEHQIEKGKILMKLGRHDEALSCFDLGFPDNLQGDHIMLLADIADAQNRKSDALRYLKLAEKSYHEEAHIVKRDEVRKRIEALKSQ